MESKSFQRFRSKIEYINQNQQMIDASLKVLNSNLVSVSDKTKYITNHLNLNNTDYNKLNHPISEKDRLLSYSRSKLAEYTILELYNSFTIYMRDITDEMYEKEPLKIVGKVNSNATLTYIEIIKLGSFDKIKEQIVCEIFRKFENERSTVKLIDKILSHTDVEIPEALKDMALMYLEMRHLFIHNKGKADAKFKNRFGENIDLKTNDKLPTNFRIVSKAIETIYLFAKTIDDQLITKNYIDKLN